MREKATSAPDKPRREETRPAGRSPYKRFWRESGGAWIQFLEPNVTGFAGARQTPLCRESCKALEKRAGVYEFALTRGKHRKIKVYVGRTDNQHRRHYTDYRRQGSSNHLLPLFEDALRRGYTIWRRIAYLKDEEDAKRKERWLLSIFDYAWNHASNGHSKRQLELQYRPVACVALCGMVQRLRITSTQVPQ